LSSKHSFQNFQDFQIYLHYFEDLLDSDSRIQTCFNCFQDSRTVELAKAGYANKSFSFKFMLSLFKDS